MVYDNTGVLSKGVLVKCVQCEHRSQRLLFDLLSVSLCSLHPLCVQMNLVFHPEEQLLNLCHLHRTVPSVLSLGCICEHGAAVTCCFVCLNARLCSSARSGSSWLLIVAQSPYGFHDLRDLLPESYMVFEHSPQSLETFDVR